MCWRPRQLHGLLTSIMKWCGLLKDSPTISDDLDFEWRHLLKDRKYQNQIRWTFCCKTCKGKYVRLWSVAMGTNGLLLLTFLASCCYLRILHSAPSSQGSAAAPENVIFQTGTCRDCHKILMRDTVIRCAPQRNDSHVSTILSYDGVRCLRDEEIACVKITDRSQKGEGADVAIKSGGVQQPYIKLNITSSQGKGYHLSVEIRGIDPSKPDCR